MELSEILQILTLSFTLLIFILMTLKVYFSNRKFKNKKNKIKKVFDSEDFFSNLESNDDNIKTKNQLKKNAEKYFANLFNNEVQVKTFFKFIETEFKKEDTTKIAWNFFIILTTSVLANNSKGLVSEAVDNIYKIFKQSRDLLLKTKESSLLTEVILKIMNLKIRPLLVTTRNFPQKNENGINVVDDKKLIEKQKNDFWKKIEELRKSLIEEKYLRFIALISLSNMTNEDIIKMLNYKIKKNISKSEKYLDKKIANITDKLNEKEKEYAKT